MSVAQHGKDSNGEDTGPDLDAHTFDNVERVKRIFAGRYDVLVEKGELALRNRQR